MTSTDGSWLDVAASGVSKGRSQGARRSSSNDRPSHSRLDSHDHAPGHHESQDDALQHGRIDRSPHVWVEDDAQAEAEANLSSESWASMHSNMDNSHGNSFHDSMASTSSTIPNLPGSFASSSRHMPNNHTSSSTITSMHHNDSNFAELDEDQEEDPFRPESMWAKATSNSTSHDRDSESPMESDITPSIASESRMSRNAPPSKSRTFAVRSPRSVKPVVYVVSPSGKNVKSPQAGSRSSRNGDSSMKQRRRKGSSLSQDENFPSRPARRTTQSPANQSTSDILYRVASIFLRILTLPLSIALQTVTVPLQSALTIFFLGVLVLTFLWYLLRNPLSALTSLSSFSVLPIGLLNVPLQLALPLKQIYCSSIGIGCEGEDMDIGRLANQIGTQALKAQDMFTSVVSLGDPSALALNHAEIWELAVAVQVSSEMENREDLGKQLADFGHKVRDVKDAMSVLHSKGISAFGWTLRRFARLEKTIELCRTKPQQYNAAKVSRQLDDLFEELERSLSDLLSGIERTIPIAHQAADDGTAIRREFGSEHSRMQKAQDDKPFWRRLKDAGSHTGRQLRRDISMTTDTIETVSKLWFNLEETRSFLLKYRDHVAYFKGGLQGFHIGDHGLDVEEEVHSLREIMERFQDAVNDARHASSPEGPKEAAAARIAAGKEL